MQENLFKVKHIYVQKKVEVIIVIIYGSNHNIIDNQFINQLTNVWSSPEWVFLTLGNILYRGWWLSVLIFMKKYIESFKMSIVLIFSSPDLGQKFTKFMTFYRKYTCRICNFFLFLPFSLSTKMKCCKLLVLSCTFPSHNKVHLTFQELKLTSLLTYSKKERKRS